MRNAHDVRAQPERAVLPPRSAEHRTRISGCMDGDDLSAGPDAARREPGGVTDRRFTPALELNREFFQEVVVPIVAPWAHSAALLGWGSDVLGLDSSRSTDHGWGPRLQVFVAQHDVEA